MFRLLFAKNMPVLERPRRRDILRCWLRGGHVLYRNQEFGELWCHGPCAGIWHLPNDPWS